MGDENPIRTLGDYSKPSHEGYRNTIELPEGNNVVPLRPDIIRTAKLRNDILMFQQHQGESLFEAWTRFKDLLQKFLIMALIFGSNGPHDTQYSMVNLEQSFIDYASLHTDEARGKWYTFKPDQNNLGDTYNLSWKSLPNLRVKRIKLGEEEAPYWTILGKRESYKPRPSSDSVGAQTPYYAKKEFMDFHLPGEWEIAKDAEINPLKDVLVFRRMVEFLEAIPINIKRNMWESEDLIENSINWDKPPKNGDGAWHA
ncbi:hypothetical protein Tco_0540968 [Tanacetum coccineum]